MASSREASQSSGHSRLKQWWRRSPSTCCSKKILLLLAWNLLFFFSRGVFTYVIPIASQNIFFTLMFLSYSFAPLIGWLADVRFGRYKIVQFGSIVSFLSSIFYYFITLTGEDSTLSKVLLSLATVLISFGFTCYSAAILPFLTDQIIGATSDELSTTVRWVLLDEKTSVLVYLVQLFTIIIIL